MSDTAPNGARELRSIIRTRLGYHGDWIKNLVLFFDGIALLLPKYMKNRPEELDPAIVAGLKQHGLLEITEPERAVDKGTTEKLATAMSDYHLLIAGARSVVASLWSVDDRSTATLMSYFYKHLSEQVPVAMALRQAQLDFINDYGDKAHPYYWAGFVVIGDGTRKIFFETNRIDIRSARASVR